MNRDAIARMAAGLRADVSVGPHRLVADEPVEAGGGDQGPGPHEYLAAALASCTAITLRMYSTRKQWPVESIEVKVGVQKSESGETTFHRVVTLGGKLDQEQRARLLDVANKCPVHKTLTGPIKIETKLAGG
jgi:putative redox protein